MSAIAHQAMMIAGGLTPVAASLLLHFEGVNGGASFPDSSSYARTMTGSGGVITSTTRCVFGVSSGYFSSSAVIQTAYTKASFDWWTSDFTIECWVYVTSLTGWYYTTGGLDVPTMIGNASPGGVTNYWSFGVVSGGKVALFYYNGSAQYVVSSATVPLNTWTHIALVKTAAGIRIFVAGVGNSATPVIGTPQSSTTVNLSIGTINSSRITGFIDELRLAKAAVYTSDFTPPTSPFPNM